MRAILFVLFAACSSSKEASPAREKPTSLPEQAQSAEPPSSTPPLLDEATQREVARRMAQEVDAVKRVENTSACVIPPTIEKATATGELKVVNFGGKTTYNYLGQLDAPDGARFYLYSNVPPKKQTLTVRARRGHDDYSRPIVIDLVMGDRTLDATSGKLVIDKVTSGLVTGYLENADMRERDATFEYLDSGCTSRVERIEFSYTR
jgi:hypothetical protein